MQTVFKQWRGKKYIRRISFIDPEEMFFVTEQEKCACGLPYDTLFAGREEAHLACADLCYDYNHTRPSDLAARETIIRTLFGKTGERFYIEPNLFCGFGFNIEIGENFFMNNNGVLVDPGKIIFGDNVFIGPNCSFYTALHPLDAALRNQNLEIALPIHVGSDVWFGGNCVVLPGVTIGSNVVIGAGSLVNHDIPDGVVAFGNPCKVRRAITSADREPYSRHLAD